MASGIPSVRVRATGLVTALGRGRDAHIEALRAGAPAEASIDLAVGADTVRMPYLGIGTATTDTEQLFAPLGDAVADALDGAELTPEQTQRMPIFVGSTSYSVRIAEVAYANDVAARRDDPLPLPFAGFDQPVVYLRERFGLFGSEFLVNTACAASANALLAATTAIAAGRCEHALVIGLELFNATTLTGFFGMQLIAPDVMRPFDARRAGLVLGEGCGAIVLSAADTAENGLHVAGGASACDTHSITASNPDGSAIANVMRTALESTNVAPGDIRAVKTHGTASPLNDDGEAAGLHHVFTAVPPITALKAYVGHTLGACGVIEAALVALALDAGFVPVAAGFSERDPKLDIDPLTRAAEAVPGHYMLNFFGFGGNNSTLIVTKR